MQALRELTEYQLYLLFRQWFTHGNADRPRENSDRPAISEIKNMSKLNNYTRLNRILRQYDLMQHTRDTGEFLDNIPIVKQTILTIQLEQQARLLGVLICLWTDTLPHDLLKMLYDQVAMSQGLKSCVAYRLPSPLITRLWNLPGEIKWFVYIKLWADKKVYSKFWENKKSIYSVSFR